MERFLSTLSDEVQYLIREKLNKFNQDRSTDNERYYILTPTNKSLYYTLLLYRPEAEYHPYIYLSNLDLNAIASINKAIRILSNSYYPLYIVESLDRPADNGDDIILFGKYRGRHLADIYQLNAKYILWIADNYQPKTRSEHRFKEIAVSYSKAYLDLQTGRKYKKPFSHHVGSPGEKLTHLELTITRVRVEDDSFKTRLIDGIEYFYVDQLITAVDSVGNLFVFTVKARDRSLVSRTLSPGTHAYQVGEKIRLESAKVLKHFESHQVKYTRLGYLRFITPDRSSLSAF